ncbi:TPA: hypothetical protein HA251_07845 [Candidatus Woesearchaeota archaeon]|nr:hypothetical protein [Candidatus Woesearchaeota archaeon]
MHDRWIIAISLCVSALGIAGLLFALIVMEPESYSLDEARALPDSAPIRVNGTVVAVRAIGNLTIITLTQPSTIDVSVDGELDVSHGDCIIVDGKKERYNGRVQVDTTRVELC